FDRLKELLLGLVEQLDQLRPFCSRHLRIRTLRRRAGGEDKEARGRGGEDSHLVLLSSASTTRGSRYPSRRAGCPRWRAPPTSRCRQPCRFSVVRIRLAHSAR